MPACFIVLTLNATIVEICGAVHLPPSRSVTHDYELPEYSLEREKHDTHEVADEPERRRMLNACSENDSGVLVEVTADFLVSVSCIEVAAWKSGLYTAPAEFLIGHPKCAPPLALA